MSDLAFKTAAARHDSSARRMRGAIMFLVLLTIVVAALLWSLGAPFDG